MTTHRNVSSSTHINSPRVYDVEKIRRVVSVKKLKRIITDLRQNIEPRHSLAEYDQLTKGCNPGYMHKPDISRHHLHGRPTREEARLAREIYLLSIVKFDCHPGLSLDDCLGAPMGPRRTSKSNERQSQTGTFEVAVAANKFH